MSNVCKVEKVGNDYCAVTTVPISDMGVMPAKLAMAQATFPDTHASAPSINPVDQTCTSKAHFGQDYAKAQAYAELVNSYF